VPAKKIITSEEVKPKKEAKPLAVKKVSKDREQDLAELQCIADAILDKKGNFVCSLDLSSIGTAICDHFVICNADSRPQVMAIADNVEEMMLKKFKRRVLRMQGKENAFWIIIDYGNIVVHVFQTEYRQFYRIEDLWADAGKTFYHE
jgi:ribosome-associated protein